MSGYSDRLAAFWRHNRLFTALLELTYRCNLDCVFCYNDLALTGRPLTLERYRSLLDELAGLGALHVALSGGEPLAHPDFFAIGAHARARGFAVRVKSNGHALRGALARRLCDEVDPYLVELSLHGAAAATHERQTRVPGSFTRLLANLEELCALGVRVQLNATLTRWNEEEIEGMFALADRHGLPLQVDPEVTPRDDGDSSPLALAPSRAGVRRLLALQLARVEGARAAGAPAPPPVGKQADAEGAPVAAGKFCGAGSSHLTIDPFGNVFPCVQWRRPVGNVHDAPLAEIWRDSPALAEVRRLEGEILERVEALGSDGRGLGFCPGLADQTSGDPRRFYPTALERLELRREIERERRPRLPVVG